MTKAVFFDMNETLLNLSVLQEQFDQHFTDKHAIKYWFSQLLHHSCVMGIMNEYQDFGSLAEAALENLFFENNKALSGVTKTEILGAFKSLPPYEDVIPALELLHRKRIRIVAISNSSLEMMKEQLTNAKIINLFDAYYSVEQVTKYKPFGDIYKYVAEQEKLGHAEITMVATHDWDLYGAKRAGFRTGYIKRKETLYHPLYDAPDFTSDNLSTLVTNILEAEG